MESREKDKKQSLLSKIIKNKLLVGLGISIIVSLLTIIITPHFLIFENLELKSIDMRFFFRGSKAIDHKTSEVIIVAIDDQSYNSIPSKWPWPRSYYAHIIRNLNRAGAKVIGIDIEFDKSSENVNDDLELANAMREFNNVVLAGKIDTELGKQVKDGKALVPPNNVLISADSIWGDIALSPDPDGIYRNYYPVRPALDKNIPSFAMEIIRRYKGYPPNTQIISSLPNYFQFGDFKIPKSYFDRAYINFYGPAGTFPIYSFETVIDDSSFDLGEVADIDAFDILLEEGIFKDKIVLIGPTLVELHDELPTPFLKYKGSQKNTPGVEIHANFIKTVLDQNYLYDIPGWLKLTIIFSVGILTSITIALLKPIGGLFATIGIVIVYLFGLAIYLFTSRNLVLEIVDPIMVILLCYITNVAYQYTIETREKSAIRGIFSKYVSKSVVDELLKSPDTIKLGGEKKVCTVFFSDVANFTTISEELSPEELVNLLNEYLGEMTDIIMKLDGTLDKYEGDAIMAFWGAPIPISDHAYRACKSAILMQQRLVTLREKWRNENKPQLSARIGINTGEMVVGNMGSQTRMDYTVIGDNVNLGSRLEGANKEYGTSVMISEATFEECKDKLIVRELDLLRVKGKIKPIKVYELIAVKSDGEILSVVKLDDDMHKFLEIYQQGIDAYKNQEWDKAINLFEQCQNINSIDGPSIVYLERAKRFKLAPPPPNWDGVFVMKHK